MVDYVINDSTELSSVEAREGGRDADKGGGRDGAPVCRMPQPEMVHDVQVLLADNVMGLIHEDKLVPRWVEF